MSTSDILLNIESISLSGDDLKMIASKMGQPNTEWILYDDLKKVSKIEDLFMGEINAVYVLLEIINDAQNGNVGHWILLILNRDTNVLTHYDSYGFNVDQETTITGQDKGLLLNLVRNSNSFSTNAKKWKLDVNKHPHQANNEREKVNTCGRFCCVRAIFFRLTNDEFNSFIITPPIKDRLIADADILVSALTGWLTEVDHDFHSRLLKNLNRSRSPPVFQ